MQAKILLIRRNVIAFLALSILVCWLANRVGGCLEAYGIDGLEGAFFSTMATNPMFASKAALACTLGTVLACALYFFARFDVSHTYEMSIKHRNVEHGAAHWASEEEMARFKAADEGRNVILSQSARLSLDKIADRRYERNKHILVLGGSGAGKSFYFLKPNILQTFASYVLTDPKGDLLEDTGQFLLDQGYEVLVINTEDPALSMGFNPFTMIQTESDILRLANCLIDNTQPPEGHKDFWVQSEQMLYEFAIGYMWFFAPKSKQNIDTLIRLVGMANVEEENEKAVCGLDILVRDMEAKYNPTDREWFLVELYNGFKKGAGKTLKSIIVSCEIRLAPFKVPQVREMMRHDETGDLSRLVAEKDKKGALFVTMSASDNTYKFLTAMVFFRLFSDCLSLAKRSPGKTLPQRLWIGGDEWAQVGKVPDFERHIAFLRSFGIDIVPILQSAAQLDEVYGEQNAKVIRGNCDTTLFLGRCDHETNKQFSEELGDETIIATSTSRSAGDSYSISEQRMARPLMSAADLGNDQFAGDECIVKIKQAAPFIDKKYDTTTHPRWHELEGASFDHASYIRASRVRNGRKRISERYSARGIALPSQDYFDDVMEELMLLEAR